jgi:hypothetical protein
MSYERPNIARMQGYTPGEQLDGDDIIKLNTNENPYPASAAVAKALQETSVAALRRYPPASAQSFRAAAATLHGVNAENLIATNGGDELLRLVLTTFVDTGETIVTTKPSYSLYPVLADIQNCKLQELPLQDDWSMPADFIAKLNQSAAKLCILVNPHAPTGTLLPVSYLKQIANSFNGILLVDEAYADFVDPILNYNAIPLAIETAQRAAAKNPVQRLLPGRPPLRLRHRPYRPDQPHAIQNPRQLQHRPARPTPGNRRNRVRSRCKNNLGEGPRTERTAKPRIKQTGIHCFSSQSNFLLCQAPASDDAKKNLPGAQRTENPDPLFRPGSPYATNCAFQ